MFKGDWKCSKCGGGIAELPFEPKGTSGLTCRECYFKEKDGGAPSEASSSPEDSSTPQAPAESSAFDDRTDIPPFDPDEFDTATEPAPDDPNSEATPATPGERKMFTGDWACAGCNGAITQLPFQPRDTSNLKCLDCFRGNK